MNITCEGTLVGTHTDAVAPDRFALLQIPAASQRFREAALPKAAIAESAPESEVFPIDSPRGDTFQLYLREIGRVKLLTPEQEIELAGRVQQGDQEAREQMIKANLRLVVKIARDYEGLGLPLLGLVSEGNIGLMKGVERFQPTKGAKPSTMGDRKRSNGSAKALVSPESGSDKFSSRRWKRCDRGLRNEILCQDRQSKEDGKTVRCISPMRPIDSFIARKARFFSAIALVGLLAGCAAPKAGRQRDMNDTQSKVSGQTDPGPEDYSEIPSDERPF